MIMLFCKLATTKSGVHHGSGCSAAPKVSEEKWRNKRFGKAAEKNWRAA
jgi:hypothetical protein